MVWEDEMAWRPGEITPGVWHFKAEQRCKDIFAGTPGKSLMRLLITRNASDTVCRTLLRSTSKHSECCTPGRNPQGTSTMTSVIDQT